MGEKKESEKQDPENGLWINILYELCFISGVVKYTNTRLLFVGYQTKSNALNFGG